jgi:hypothetical protein
MEAPVHISEVLKNVDLAWWPDFLMAYADRPDTDQDSFTVSLRQLASALAEENSLA